MTLFIRLFGEFSLAQDDTAVSPGPRKAEALFAYLVLRARPLARETAATLFWDDSTPDQAMANLRKLLSHMRPPLAPYLQVDRQNVAFNHGADYRLDVADFARLLAEGRLETAVSLYRGDFLAGMQLPEARDFEAWLLLERERYRRQFAEALRALAGRCLQRRAYEEGIAYARRLLALDPLSEQAHRQLILLLARSGQTEAALAQYETCRQALAEALGVAPMPATLSLAARLQTAVTQPAALPEPADSFVGREEELALIHRHLDDPGCRLLTVVGPGGIGKTRLALQAAAGRANAYLHGVHFVSLAGVDSENGFVTAVAEVFNLSLAGTTPPRPQLAAFLQTRELLLLLDNGETLFQTPAAGVEVLVALLQQAPRLQILATSRERFNFQAEQVMQLAGLPYPAPEAVADADAGSPAVRLFVERAQTAVPGFRLTAENRPHVARICRLVAGTPLAIELAATALANQDAAGLAAAVAQNLDVLQASEPASLPPRHHSLRAVFDSSWQHLLPAEQHTFRRLSVFRGSFTAAAATAVAEAHYQDLLGLVDKSFLRLGEDGRYHLHDVLRHYAADQLAAAGEEAAVADRHMAFFCHFLQVQGQALNGAGVGEAQKTMRRELENARQAWQWAISRQQWRFVAQAAAGLSRCYQLQGPFQEGVALFARAIAGLTAAEAATPEAQRLLAECHIQMALFLNEQGAYAQAEEKAQAALAQAVEPAVAAAARLEVGRALVGRGLYETAVPHLQATLALISPLPAVRQPEIAAALQRVLGLAAVYQGAYGEAYNHFSDALQISRQTGNRWLESGLLNNLGVVSKNLGDLAAARAYYEQNLAIAAEIGDQRGQSKALLNLGVVMRNLGQLAGARAAYEAARRLKQEIGDRQGEALALNNLGTSAAQQGDLARAQASLTQALQLFREIGRRRDEAMVLSNLGLLAYLTADYATAVASSEQALILARQIGDRSTEAYALMHIGHGRAGRGEWPAAAAAYRQALQLRQEMGETLMMLESQAGLARVRLAEGDLATAQELIAPVLSPIQAGEMGMGEQPFQVYLTCYEILAAAGDGRARPVLRQAHALLHKQAAQLADAPARQAFLENVAAHRAIIAAWSQLEA